MKKDTIVTVNGQRYDTATGLPVAGAPAVPPTTKPTTPRTTSSAHSLHAAPARSKTLQRAAVKKQTPAPTPPSTKPAAAIQPRKPQPSAPTSKPSAHPQVKKFAPATQNGPVASRDIAPRQHPHAAIAARGNTAKNLPPKPRPSTAHPVSANAPSAQTAPSAASTTPSHKNPARRPRRHTRALRWTALVFVVLIVLGVVVWVNLPAISVRIAASQSGIEARVPHFMPDGYRLRLPVTAEDNRVVITFASNQNSSSFTLTQEKSTWDSQAVRALVERQSNGQFLTTNDRGLTVYTFNGNAAWVNRGILYQIAGESQLSNDTILRIANSL